MFNVFPVYSHLFSSKKIDLSLCPIKRHHITPIDMWIKHSFNKNHLPMLNESKVTYSRNSLNMKLTLNPPKISQDAFQWKKKDNITLINLNGGETNYG